ncbi:hypothetical protein [Viscerimonas tarda]
MAAKPPLPTPLSPKGDRHSDQREESPAHISNFLPKGISSKIVHAFVLLKKNDLIESKVYFFIAKSVIIC